jgi:tryptophan synthase alpha chain
LIEVGIPFSDPMADGPVIQRSSMRALRNGAGVVEILEVIEAARREMDVPVVLFSYLNPLLQFGLERLAGEARRSGVDGVLVTDLALEEANELRASLAENDLDHIFLIAPTTSDERLRMIAKRARGFIYAVSRTGVTGQRSQVSGDAERLVARVRTFTDLPVAVGFGISTSEQVSGVWRYADAAVVGSAIVAQIEALNGDSDLVKHVGELMRQLLPERADDKHRTANRRRLK